MNAQCNLLHVCSFIQIVNCAIKCVDAKGRIYVIIQCAFLKVLYIFFLYSML